MNFELMKKRRKELGMTQQDLADKCGLSKTTIFNYENEISEPAKNNLKKIAEILEVSEVDLAINTSSLEEIEMEGIDFDCLEAYCTDLYDVIISKFNDLPEFKNINFEKVEILVSSTINFFKKITGYNVFYSYLLDKLIFFDTDFKIIETSDLPTFVMTLRNLITISQNYIFDFEEKYNFKAKKLSYFDIAKILRAEYDFEENLYKNLSKSEENKPFNRKTENEKIDEIHSMLSETEKIIHIVKKKKKSNKEGGSDE